MDENLGMEVAGAIAGAATNRVGILGVWVTLIVFFVRNELNHRKLRSDSESTMREQLLARMKLIEESAAAERAACREETRELRTELAQVNQRFFEFQMATLNLTMTGPVTTKATITTVKQEESTHG